MSIDTSAPLFTATAEHLVETVVQARAEAARAIRERDEARRERDVEHAEATIQRLRADALDGRCAELEHENRTLRNANESWQILAARQAPTEPLPRVPATPEPPVRTRGWRTSTRGKHA